MPRPQATPMKPASLELEPRYLCFSSYPSGSSVQPRLKILFYAMTNRRSKRVSGSFRQETRSMLKTGIDRLPEVSREAFESRLSALGIWCFFFHLLYTHESKTPRNTFPQTRLALLDHCNEGDGPPWRRCHEASQ